MLILTGEEVEQLLDMPGCMAAMEEALVALARGEFHLPLRPGRASRPGESHLLGLMPTFRSRRAAAVRAEDGRRRPGQPAARARPAPGHGHALRRRRPARCVAVMNATPITAIRTAAVSGRRDAGAGPRGRPRAGDRRRRPPGAIRTSRRCCEARPFERDPDRGPHARERRAARRRVAGGPCGRVERGGRARRRRGLHRHAVRGARARAASG